MIKSGVAEWPPRFFLRLIDQLVLRFYAHIWTVPPI